MHNAQQNIRKISIILELSLSSQKNKIIYTNQFGFRTNHSTNHALINAFDKLYEGLDKGEMAIGVIEKAFVCINHSILLDKL